ncbi:MAG: nucleotidyltransferase domain-containing protein [Candidatus Bathyarchaeia archaeon]
MKRATLERNLKEVIRRLNSAFLPVTILKVFVHGSFFRGEELPGDLDVVILLKVKDEFEYWHRMFSDLSKCYDRIVDCYMKGMTVSEAFSGPLLSEIRRRNIPLDWIVVMSWSDIFGQTSPYIPLFMNWEKL